MRPEFIYFDLGNVICFFDRRRQIHQVAELSGIAEDQVADLLIGSVGLHWRYETAKLTTKSSTGNFVAHREAIPNSRHSIAPTQRFSP
jgi:hypothetical protein